jgi:hypothetical protein
MFAAENARMFHYDAARLGQGPGAPPDANWHKYRDLSLGSPVRGAVLYLENWTFENGPRRGEKHKVVFVCGSDNRVAAFAEDELRAGSTTPIWSQVLGSPVRRAGSNIPAPIGITSTALLDPDNQRMFVMSYQDVFGTGVYFVFALDLDTGCVIQRAQLHDSGQEGRPTFDGNTVDQRGGLNLVNGLVLATFADFLGYDAGTYHGWVVGCRANNLAHQRFLCVTKTVLGGGCWGPGGAAADNDGTLYIGTGNATTADAAYWAGLPAGVHPGDIGDFFEAVVKISTTGGRLQVVDWYQPTNAKEQNDADLDFGSSSPLVLPDVGGKQLVVISTKFGIYLLDRKKMGHWGGELWKAEGNLATGQGFFPEESHSAPAFYKTPSGDHLLYFVGGGLPGLIAFKVVTTASGAQLEEVWRANGTGINCGNTHGSPTIGSVSSPPFALVWIVDCGDGTPSGKLRAFNALTGREVFNSANATGDDLGGVPHYPPITCAGNSVFVGTATGFACYGPKDPCQSDVDLVSSLSDQISNLQDALDSREIPPPPRTPAKIAAVKAEIQKLRQKLVIAEKALRDCRALHP